MKAIVCERYGSPDVLELRDIAEPRVKGDEVLLKVRAASVNPADWHFMRGQPFILRLAGFGLLKPKQPILGVDLAGRVEEVGEDVTSFRPGDDVYGGDVGAFAEYASVPERVLAPKPENLTFEQAAAVPLAAVTALQGLRDKGQVRHGQRVLIIGASGGVGTFAVQIAKSLGAEVTGVCSSRNVEMVRSIGADQVIDYTREDLTRDGRRYDLVFQLAGTLSPSACRRVLTPKGTLVLSSGQGRIAGLDRIVMALALSPFVGQKLCTFVAAANREDLTFLKCLIEARSVVPVIDRNHGLSEVPEAIRYLEAGRARGKVTITV